MKRTLTIIAIATLLGGTAVYSARSSDDGQKNTGPGVKAPAVKAPPVVKKPVKTPRIDIVIALDTSGSMSGLLDAARQKMWDIVNEVAKAKPAPRLRVGLMTFGGNGTEKDGFVTLRSDLTTDLDMIYSKLMELGTDGSTEYVGRVVHRSINEMSWDTDQDALRQIYVAGNESADQDRTVTAAAAMKQARERGIFVNAVYCGDTNDGVAPSWRTIARQGEGMYASIDHNHGTVTIASPYDRRLSALSARLNRTYVAYGRRGAAASANQLAQDSNAQRVHASAAATRALAKASAVYTNDSWDLVDARKAGKLKKIRKAALPVALRDKSEAEITAVLDAKEKERQEIRKQVKELSAKRKVFVAAEMKRQGKTAGKSFSTAVKRAFRKQARKKGIRMKK